jgi:hypothetical protein
LVEPTDVAVVTSALRAEFDAHEVSRRALSLDALVAMGALSGRLRGA